MTGQDAIKSAGEFNRRVGVTGVVLTKLDGDARGGAALSVVSVVGVPIAFVGSGERLEDLEPFHPDRVVSRVLGMGDVLSLIERAEAAIDDDDAERLEEKIRANEFTLEDFRDQLKTIRKMGPLEQIMGMLPGMGNIKALAENKPDEKQIVARRGDHQLDDAGRAAQAAHHQRQPPEAHREGQRHVGRGSESAAEAVRADAEDVEVSSAGWPGWPAAARRRAARRCRCCATGGRPVLEDGSDMRRRTRAASRAANFGVEIEPRVRIQESTMVVDSFASGRFQEASVLPRRRHRFARRARQQLRRNPRALQSAHQAGAWSRSTRSAWTTGSSKGAQPSDSVRTLIARHLTPERGAGAGRRRSEPTAK